MSIRGNQRPHWPVFYLGKLQVWADDDYIIVFVSPNINNLYIHLTARLSS